MEAGYLASIASIVLVDLLLAGDNAVVIAMAVKPLPADKRRKGILFGAGAAVLLRVVLTFFVSKLLLVPFVKLGGGLLILWIAVKLFLHGDEETGPKRDASTIAQAVRLIVIADISMSLDNMLAVGGIAHGDPFLLLFGLALSIPFVVLTSNLLSKLMDRYWWLVFVGAGILGKVGAEMILTDPLAASILHPSHLTVRIAEAAGAVAIMLCGWYLSRSGRDADREPA